MAETDQPPASVVLPAFLVEKAAAELELVGNTTTSGMLREARVDLGWVLAQAKAAEWQGLNEGGLPKHLPMGVDADGNGPTDPEPPHHRVCWCADPECTWTEALAAERADSGVHEDSTAGGPADGNRT